MQCIIVSTSGASNLLDLAIFHAQLYTYIGFIQQYINSGVETPYKEL